MNRDAYDRAYQEAEKLRQLRRAGLIQRSWFAKISSRGAGSVGRKLIELGQRLVNQEALTNVAIRTPAVSTGD